VAELGPTDGSLVVQTYREGVAAKVGHDLVIDVTSWQATLDDQRVQLTADPRSLRVREGHRGVKPLSDRDRDEIRKNIDDKVLRGQPISFTGTVTGQGDTLDVDGELTMAGTTRPLRTGMQVTADGRATATLTLKQSDWGIKPYRGMMGALKVRDELEVVLDVRLPGT
jgi:polyisoprenoid-binding protein YceI